MPATEQAKNFDIVVAGELNPDLILSGQVVPAFGQVEKLVDDATLTIGSSSAIFACGAARLGLRVAFIGKVGDDIFGQYMRQALEDYHIDTQGVLIDPQVRTGLSVILSQGNDRAILTYPGAIPCLKFAEIPRQLIAQARHLHLASYFMQEALRPDVPALFDLAHSKGLSVSLDTNYDPSEKWDGSLTEALERTDIFLPNATECCAIAGIRELAQAASLLAQKVKIVAIKLGRDGGQVYSRTQMHQAPSLQVQVTDTVGAGDSFDAGFIYGYLANWDLKRTLRLATACGSLSTRQAGGTAAQPTLEETIEYL